MVLLYNTGAITRGRARSFALRGSSSTPRSRVTDMQSIGWYVSRLRSMSPAEIAWRVGSLARDQADRIRITAGWLPSEASVIDNRGGLLPPALRLSDVEPGEWTRLSPDRPESEWLPQLQRRANELASNRFTFFSLTAQHLGTPIDWHRDHESGKASPQTLSLNIDYRDFSRVGDAKMVWEPSRHQHLVVLGRAWRATGDKRFAAAVVEHIDAWLAANPFGTGMNWRSPLELAIRVINWVWAFDLIRDAGVITPAFERRALYAAYLHLWDVSRKFSQGSSANNHLIGEAAGVFIGASFFPRLPHAREWRDEAGRHLAEQILIQNAPDGGNREQAIGYHLFVLQFYLAAAAVARHDGYDFPRAFWERLEKMTEFVARLREGGEALPMYGDADDGYVLDLGNTPDDPTGVLATGAGLFNRPDFAQAAGGPQETARWLLGREHFTQSLTLYRPHSGERLASVAFPDTGYYLLQSGHKGQSDRVSIMVDCGELGYESIAAHGHADALSVVIRVGGRDVLVDPGTYDYFRWPEWRVYFRSTRAHNTVMVDGTDQSTMTGPFLWGQRAHAKCIAWEPSASGGRIVAEHDGYTRLDDPVRHRRTVSLNGDSATITIEDQIVAAGSHSCELYWHFAEDCVVTPQGSGTFNVTTGERALTMTVDQRLDTSLLRGSESPIAGWVSRGYHRKSPAVTLIGRVLTQGSTTWTTQLRLS